MRAAPKNILMVAFHYPPVRGSSGIQRTLTFSRYLPRHGWQPIVLTAHPRAYSQIGDDQLQDIPGSVPVERAFAWDTAQHLSIKGAYPTWMALPDRWVSWWLGAVPAGLRLSWRYKPRVIWSTYPIATAHLIGLTLHWLTGKPWIADFRDSMTEDDYPPDPSTRKVYRCIERLTVKHSTRSVFTTPGTLRMYAERYPAIPPSHWTIIANGYDEDNFLAAEQTVPTLVSPPDRLVLVHSGALYPWERDPRAFFAAVATLRQAGAISQATLKVVLRASGHETSYRQQLRENGIDDVISLEPAISYREALAEMLTADGLLIFQASNCNHQIPAKIYEYLRARRPIFAMTDPIGDTAEVLKTAGINTIVPWDSKEQIARGLLHFLAELREGRAPIAKDSEIDRHSRAARTRELAELVDSIAR
jgi:hypothetical protein